MGQSLHHGIWTHEGHSTLMLCFAVGDLDAALTKVRAAGGTAEASSAEPFGRVAMCRDDQGVDFSLYEPSDGVQTGANTRSHREPGDLAYITMEVIDSGRARSFYGAVLDWQLVPGRVEQGWMVERLDPAVGLRGGVSTATSVPLYIVADIQAGVERVRASGGQASDPETQPYGITSDCTDDQATRFGLVEMRSGD